MIRKLPALICGLILCGILAAGLAPFQRPRNAVTWLGNENGLHFGNYGTIYSPGTLEVSGTQDKSSCSIEIWMQPARAIAANTFLSFYRPENRTQFTLQQYQSNLIVGRGIRGKQHRSDIVGVEGVFREIKPVFISITSGAQKTSVYLNGALAESFPQFRLDGNCTGRLVIGTSPIRNERWSGKLKGLAIYRWELNPAQVREHYESWTTQGRPDLSGDENALAVYLFNERSGKVVHSAVGPGMDLYIPERYSILHQKFLEPFWEEFKPKRGYWKDVLINIVGFIPFGFFFCAYWSSVRPIKHPVFTTIALGFTVSLTIEILQSYLPTRGSGTTDLITNTLGTFIGTKLYALKSAQAFPLKRNKNEQPARIR
jgi:VanZ family protein